MQHVLIENLIIGLENSRLDKYWKYWSRFTLVGTVVGCASYCPWYVTMTRQTSFVYIISDRTESADSDTYSVSSVNNAHMELTSVTSMNSTIQHLYCLLYSSGAHYKNIPPIISQISPAWMLFNIVNILLE